MVDPAWSGNYSVGIPRQLTQRGWGGATLGVAIGVIIALVRPGFDWWVVGKGLTIGTFVGALSEWIPRTLAGRRRSKSLAEEHFQISENATEEELVAELQRKRRS